MKSEGKILIPKLGLVNECFEVDNMAIPLNSNQDRMKWSVHIPSDPIEKVNVKKNSKIQLPSPFIMPNEHRYSNQELNFRMQSHMDYSCPKVLGNPINNEIKNDFYNIESANKIVNTPYMHNTNLFNFLALDKIQNYTYNPIDLSKLYFYQGQSPEMHLNLSHFNSNLSNVISPAIPSVQEMFDFKNRRGTHELPYDQLQMVINPYYYPNFVIENPLVSNQFVPQEIPPPTNTTSKDNKKNVEINSEIKDGDKAMIGNSSAQELRKYKIQKFKLKKIRMGWTTGKRKIKNEAVGKKFRVNGKFVKKDRALALISIPLNLIAHHPVVLKTIKSKSNYAISATVEGVTFYNFDSLIQEALASLENPPKENESEIEVKINKIDHHRKTIQISIDKNKENMKKSENQIKEKDKLNNLYCINYYAPRNIQYEILRNNLKKVPISHFDQHLNVSPEKI